MKGNKKHNQIKLLLFIIILIVLIIVMTIVIHILKNKSKSNAEYVIKQFYDLLGQQETDSIAMLEELGFKVETVQNPMFAPSNYVE